MTFIRAYVAVYFSLLAGTGLALRESGIMRELPTEWLVLGAILAVGVGVLLAVASHSRTVPTK